MRFSTSRAGRGFLLLAALCALAAASGCRDDTWQLWQSYSARFIEPATGRVFDPTGDQHTTSEGQAYAMFFALVADDRPTFDRVLDWTQTNLAGGDLGSHLPAWLWGKNKSGQFAILDPNSASDADTWIAYSLIEAGRLWNAPSDTSLGQAMLALIAKNEVANLPGFGAMLLPGPQGFQHGASSIINPSYLPLFLFERFAQVDPAGPWNQIALNIPHLLQESSRHGYAMDWVEYVPGDGFYAAINPIASARPESRSDPPANASVPLADPSDQSRPEHAVPSGSYDAIRVYLWAGLLDRNDPARDSVLNAVAAMSFYLGTHDNPPEEVDEDGITGTTDGPVCFSAAVLPYLRAFPDGSRAAVRQIIRIDKQKDAATGLFGNDKDDYDQSLTLFATGFIDARFAFGQAGKLNVEWKRQ
jgi:endoglucanase